MSVRFIVITDGRRNAITTTADWSWDVKSGAGVTKILERNHDDEDEDKMVYLVVKYSITNTFDRTCKGFERMKNECVQITRNDVARDNTDFDWPRSDFKRR